MCTVPGAYGGRRGPRHGPGQRVVDLERGRVAAELPHPGDGPAGQLVVADQAPVELFRADAGQHGAAHLDLLVQTLHCDRPPPGDHDLGGGGAADQPAAVRLEPATQRLRELHRPRRPVPDSPTVCPSMHSSSPMKPDPAASSGMSAWQAFPASSSRAASPPNSSNSVHRRRQHAADEGQPADPGQPRGGLQPGPQRRHRRGQRIDDLTADRVPAAGTTPARPRRRPGARPPSSRPSARRRDAASPRSRRAADGRAPRGLAPRSARTPPAPAREAPVRRSPSGRRR